ncbi:hypothetical protein JTE90_024640 [Oedothorax gibbosus]|uniref:Telomeric repeat-binding factor 2-interacting protein 1 n=1 Tax=Oedothorax gibbosus TaxID=931172 RepID=A0AAV6U355_9ARAC|nr:hypothetical protein JTE90_024640 [Oedothorax gibbosus]
MEFTHSIVLFSGDDGLPLEFNVRNTNEKSLLKAMIEHGGGLCTQSDNAVHLISPGTKVLNADLGKKLVSSRYVFDCVDQNYLLEVNDYVFTISEEPTSDISDEDEEIRLFGNKSPKQLKEKMTDLISNIDLSTTDDKESHIDSSATTPSKLSSTNQKSLTSSNQSESFVEGSQDITHNPRIAGGIVVQNYECIPLTSTAKEPDSLDMPDNYEDMEQDLSPIQASASLVNPPIRKIVPSQYEDKTSPKKVRFNQNILSPVRAPILSQGTKTLMAKVNKIGGMNLSPKKASASQVSPKKSTIIPSQSEKQNSPKQLRKNIAGPSRALPVIQQKEIPINEIAATESSNLDHVEMSSDPSNEDVAFNVSPQKRSFTFPRYERIEDKEDEVVPNKLPVAASPLHTAVSSSQQGVGDFDQFDNMLISKAQQQVPSDDELSQSYTVSSSADAQKPSSGEMFAAAPASQLPDSPTNDRSQAEDELDEQRLYIKRLEAEVEQILLKPSPKSIQDKICLVKYICCVKKLPPRSVLQSLTLTADQLELH